MSEEKRHLHFVIWAATDKVGDSFQGITYVDIIAKDINEAIKRAKTICPGKKYYWVNNIVEHHQNHGKEA